MKTTGMQWTRVLVLGLAGALGGGAALAAPPVAPAKKKASGPIAGEALPGEGLPKTGSRLDVLFVIDSTGSMGGLVEDGKKEMRKIIDEILAGDPKPDLRVGLLTYRDHGDDYLTKHIPLSRDFEAFYKFMAHVESGGGGDWEEDVSRAMHVSVSLFNWDMDKNTARMIFLFGDAPAHTDYGDFDFKKEADIARSKKITINAFAMNTDEKVKEQWTYMAKATGGIYKVIGTGMADSADYGDDDHYEKDYTGAPAGTGAGGADAPKSDFGRSVTDAVKAAAAKSGTSYDKAPAPPKKKTPK